MFRKVLVANRGEIACRILRTCKRLGIATVAVYSDADAGLPHVTLADEAVRLGPPPVKDSYLQVGAILDAAKQTGAEAIHPGYGLLSEKSDFAAAVADAGLVFVGPPPSVLDAFGDKMKARHVALRAGVAPVPGLDEPLPLDGEAAFEAAKKAAANIGYPLVVKAVGGGGGIGMQIVNDENGLERALKSCADRGRSSFGDPRVYLERYIESPRHIEVQVLFDSHGFGVALGERECSVQRRHQKIIEETPSPAPFFQGEEGEAKRRAIFEAAVAVMKSVGYVGAGTCELIADGQGNLYFLEVNARLQVEHPVTEMCTGLDLVEWQLRIAKGEKLPEEFANLPRRGHSIEARVYAEDPAKMFVPQPGKLQKIVWPEASSDLRVETGVVEGADVTPYYDPMIAKIVSHGATREEAIARLDRALAETTIDLQGPRGPSATNVGFLRKVLAAEEFRSGLYDTRFAEALAKRK